MCPDLDRILRRQIGINKRMGAHKVEGIWKKCADDPEYYIFGGFCRSFDEKDRTNPIKTFPREKPLLRFLDHIHSGGVGDIAASSKSRQQMFSWVLAGYASHQAKFTPFSRIMYQGKKADDSNRFVYRNSFGHSRIGFIERALPLFLRSYGLKGTIGDLWYPNNSVISSLGKGTNQARSFSASLFIFDEAAFIEEFGDTYRGVLPMAKGDPNNPNSGGRIIAISSAQGGTEFAELIEKTGKFNYHEDDRTKIAKGTWEYTTTNGVRVLEIYYPAFPFKDPDTIEGQTWLHAAVKGYRGGMAGTDWRQEMEGDYRVQSGHRVWESFDTEIYPRVTFDPAAVEVQDHWPIYAGMDWGLVNPTVFTIHAMESLEKAYQIDEIYVAGKSPQDVAEILKGKWYFKHLRGIQGDPSIWRRLPRKDEPGMTSIGEMFAAEGVHIAKGRNDPGSDMVYLTLLQNNLWRDLDNPKWMISRKCINTINCYRNLRLAPNTGRKDHKDDPEKLLSKEVDPFDANKYFSLSIGFEMPEDLEAPPNSFDWWMARLEEQADIVSWMG